MGNEVPFSYNSVSLQEANMFVTFCSECNFFGTCDENVDDKSEQKKSKQIAQVLLLLVYRYDQFHDLQWETHTVIQHLF